MAKTDWHHYDFGDYRIGVTPIDGMYALLFLVDDTAYPLATYANEDAAREAMRVLDAGMAALAELKESGSARPRLRSHAKDKRKGAATAKSRPKARPTRSRSRTKSTPGAKARADARARGAVRHGTRTSASAAQRRPSKSRP